MRAFKKFNFKYFLLDNLLLITSLILMTFIRRDGIFIKEDFIDSIYVLLINIFMSFILGIYNKSFFTNFREIFNLFLTRLILVLTIFSFFFIVITEESFSRFIIISALFIWSIINLIFSFFYFKIDYNGYVDQIKSRNNKLIILKILELMSFILLCYYNCNGGISFFFDNIYFLVFNILFFLLINNLEHKFVIKSNYKNFWSFQWEHIKSNILFAGSIIAFLLLFYEKDILIYSNIFVNISILGLLDFMIMSLVYFNIITEKKFEITKSKLLKAVTIVEIENKNGNLNGNKYSLNNEFSHYLSQSLGEIYLKKFPELYKHLDEKLDLYSFDIRKSVIIRSSDTYNIDVIPEKSLEFYTNLHELNDFRRINEYLIKVNKSLINGGVFIGNFEPSILRYQKLKNKYPFYLANLFYLIDFIWKRIFPKVPFLKYMYFELTKGRNRVLSLAEVLGRLHYCGFKVISFNQIEEKIYFIAKKVTDKISVQQPTYGPLIKLKRVGKNGDEIWVYKFRTMSPYSEFLQEFIFENFSLKDGGKFNKDFRITSWGKFMRKLWLDELPMFINFFRGELKIVGVRPISFHYFNLYPEDFKKIRIKYKPGLVPPFYYDLPKTLEEIIDSERKYLLSYDKNPILTDLKYFTVALKNILFKKARSG